MPEERPGTPDEQNPLPAHVTDGSDRTIPAWLSSNPAGASSENVSPASSTNTQSSKSYSPPQPPSGGESSAPNDRWIAGYRVISTLGEGGMGVVYEAEQRSPRRPVALKVIRGGAFVDEQAARLFQREIQTLARLKHPGIAGIYEAGRTDSGQRFFAMELVRGVPLDAYAGAHSLPPDATATELRERLELFLQICDAINYAHQRGVIHRDIKPANIQVMSDQDAVTSNSRPAWQQSLQVKILDFGLARITDADVNATAVLTEVGQIAGTLTYMSPEQARGNPDEIDLRTDVYSLGMVLYELLTGQLPYEIPAGQLPLALQTICEQAPRPPSAVRKHLRGDLETIVLKALEKEPERRYQSVLALADDIERYLKNQPILARPPSAAYQMRKLIARHRTPFALAAALVLLLIAFAVTMAFMFGVQRRERLRADRARALAEREEQKAEQVNRFLQDMLASVDPEQAQGRDVTVREILDQAAGDIGRELSGEPEVQAALRNTIGTTYLALGLLDDAEPQLRAALAMRQDRLGDGHPEVIASLNELGNLLNAKGAYASAESVFTISLTQSRATFGGENEAVADAINNLGLAIRYQGRHADAEPLLREALAMRRRLLGNNHRDTAASLNNLALTLYDLGRYNDAEPLYREALEIQQNALGPDHLEVALTLNNLALLLRRTGDLTEAEHLYRRALSIQRKMLGEEHPSIVVTLINLAGILRAKGDYGAAEPGYAEALAMAEHVLGPQHPHVAAALLNLGGVRVQLGRLGLAEADFRRAAGIYEMQFGTDHPYRATALERLGTVIVDSGRAADAEASLREALRIRMAVDGAQSWRTALAKNALGHCLGKQNRFSEAESLLVASCETLERSPDAPLEDRRQALQRTIDYLSERGLDAQAGKYRNALAGLAEGD